MKAARNPNSDLFEQAATLFQELQSLIIAGLEEVEREEPSFHPEALVGPERAPAVFQVDRWERTAGTVLQGGGGITRVLEQGRIFERAGVNFSDVSGIFSEDMARSMPGASPEFRATGVSLVLHPRNPHAPIVHANFRAIRRGAAGAPDRLWFGGGADLTPCILYEEDARSFHTEWRDVCARHPTVADYAKMKNACDEYFFLPHRGEARGIGGIFFDYLDSDGPGILSFVEDAGRSFLNAYKPILSRRSGLPYGESERRFQLLRRGRYVEFNLVYDRGTQFGLRTGGRTESILMSLPPVVHWSYEAASHADGVQDDAPATAAARAALMEVLRRPKQWV